MSSLFRLTRLAISSPFVGRGLLNRVFNYAPNRPRTHCWPAIPLARAQGTVADIKSPEPVNQTDLDEQKRVRSILTGLDRNFSRFEERCQRSERVAEREFAKTFDSMTRAVELLESMNKMTDDIKVNLALLSAILLRCCGKLMSEAPDKTREMLAGNLWLFIKEKNIPLDISHYNSLLRVLNENKTVYDPQKLLEEIKAANLVPDRVTYQRLIHQYCLQGDINGATQLLEIMKDLELELNELTFASLIIGYSKQEQPPSMKEMFDLMRSNNVEPSGRSYAAAIVSLAQLLPKNPTLAESELGLIYSSLEKDEIQFTINEQIEITNGFSSYRDNEVVSKILAILAKSQPSTINSRYKLMSALLKSGQVKEATDLYWSQQPTQRALATGSLGTYYIKLLATCKDIPVDLCIKECEKMREMGHNGKPHHLLYYHAAEAGNLDLVRASLEKIGEEEPLKVPYYWPLLAQAKDEETILSVLKNDFSPSMDNNDLLDTFSQWVWPRFPNPSKLFELNKDLKYDTNLLMASFLSYSVQEDKIMDAIKFVSEVPEDIISSVDMKQDDDAEPTRLPRGERSDQREALIGRLLRQISDETKDPELVAKAFKLCLSPGFNVTSRTVSPLVKTHLLNDNFDLALQEFIRLANEYRVTPCKADLMIHCLEKKDPDSLQKIMNIATEFYGESNALFDLAVACLKVGKLKQAQKIFASPSFRVNPIRVHRMCRQLGQQANVEMLENFVQLSRDMYDVNQEYLYQILIETYDRTSNAKAALELWNRMQEEEFQPSKRSLLTLARVLENNNIEVPFQKPRNLDDRPRRRNRSRDFESDERDGLDRY